MTLLRVPSERSFFVGFMLSLRCFVLNALCCSSPRRQCFYHVDSPRFQLSPTRYFSFQARDKGLPFAFTFDHQFAGSRPEYSETCRAIHYKTEFDATRTSNDG